MGARYEDASRPTRYDLRCGACGAWREPAPPRVMAARFEAALAADRAAIGRALDRLAAAREAPPSAPA